MAETQGAIARRLVGEIGHVLADIKLNLRPSAHGCEVQRIVAIDTLTRRITDLARDLARTVGVTGVEAHVVVSLIEGEATVEDAPEDVVIEVRDYDRAEFVANDPEVLMDGETLHTDPARRQAYTRKLWSHGG